jgi:hypothetical protein
MGVLEPLYVAVALIEKLDTCRRTLHLEYIEDETGLEYATWGKHRSYTK